MTTVMPQGELAKKALAWICEQMRDAPSTPLSEHIVEAGRRFNLSPLDEDFLRRFLKENPNSRPDAC